MLVYVCRHCLVFPLLKGISAGFIDSSGEFMRNSSIDDRGGGDSCASGVTLGSDQVW